MSFRPRFRLSLLFVIVALVAGMSVWLRQAVVRDRNIRQLLAEEWISGEPEDQETNLNTKILNYFCNQNPYRDNINSMVILIHKMSSANSYLKYDGFDLGSSVRFITIRAWDDEDSAKVVAAEDSLPRRQILLSQIFFFMERFSEVQELHLDWATIVDDISSNQTLNCNSQQLELEFCIVDSLTVLKLQRTLKIPPQKVMLNANHIRGSLLKVEELKVFSEDKIGEFERQNDWSIKRDGSINPYFD